MLRPLAHTEVLQLLMSVPNADIKAEDKVIFIHVEFNKKKQKTKLKKRQVFSACDFS